MKENQESQIWEYQYQGGPTTSSKEHCQQEKISEFQELLHLKTHHGRVGKDIGGSISLVVFVQLCLPAD